VRADQVAPRARDNCALAALIEVRRSELKLIVSGHVTRLTIAVGCTTLLALSVVGCGFTSATDVVVHGRVVDENGHPVRGIAVRVMDLKIGFYPEGDVVAKEETVYTDSDGNYSAKFDRLHSAVTLWIPDYAKPHANCPRHLSPDESAPQIDKEKFVGKHELRHDLVYCVGPPLSVGRDR
jgi:hypothetical protein